MITHVCSQTSPSPSFPTKQDRQGAAMTTRPITARYCRITLSSKFFSANGAQMRATANLRLEWIFTWFYASFWYYHLISNDHVPSLPNMPNDCNCQCHLWGIPHFQANPSRVTSKAPVGTSEQLHSYALVTKHCESKFIFRINNHHECIDVDLCACLGLRMWIWCRY